MLFLNFDTAYTFNEYIKLCWISDKIRLMFIKIWYDLSYLSYLSYARDTANAVTSKTIRFTEHCTII